MARVKRALNHLKKRKNILRAAKGYRWQGKNLLCMAKNRLLKAGVRARADRRKKKGYFRGVWHIKINAAARLYNVSYSRLIGSLKQNNVEVNTKMLADLAANHPTIFQKFTAFVK